MHDTQSSRPAGASHARPSAADGIALQASVREAQHADFLGICAVLQRNGLQGFRSGTWEALWVKNPALGDLHRNVPIGWVLESDNEIVGFFGNFALRYFLGDVPLRAAAATSWAVDKSFRGQGLELLYQYLGQPSVDMLIDTTASDVVERLMRSMGMPRIPQGNVDKSLFLPLNNFRFLNAFFRRRGLSHGLSKALSCVGFPIVCAEEWLRRRGPGPAAPPEWAEIVSLDKLGDDFDVLWRAKRAEATRLLGDRSAEALRWHLTIHGDYQAMEIFGARREGNLLGYLILAFSSQEDVGLRRARIMDIFVGADDQEITDGLLRLAFTRARIKKCDIFEMIGFPKNIRRIFEAWNPYTRQLPSWPYLCRFMSSQFARALEEEDSWYFSPYDGDSFI